MMPAPPGDGRETLECSCCGDDGAEANAAGEFYDGQALTCGCAGHVCVEEDGEAWIHAVIGAITNPSRDYSQA